MLKKSSAFDFFKALFSVKFIVTLGIVFRLVGYLSLPSQPSSFAPDEGTYAKLVEWISSGKLAAEFPDYGDGLFNSARLLILPSLGINRLGFSSLESVRLTSLLFGLMNIILFYFLLKSITRNRNHDFSFRLILATYLFMPSHLTWSILGLRESVTEFGLLLTFFFTRRIFLNNSVSILNYILLFLSLFITYNARPQLGLVLSIVIFSSIFIVFRKDKIVILALLFFPIANTFASSFPIGLPQIATTVTGKYSSSPSEISDFFIDKRQGNQLFANSKIETPDCNIDSTTFSSIKCEMIRLPLAIPQVTFRPLIFLDSGSLSQNLASLENLIWIFLYVYVLFSTGSLIRSNGTSFQVPAIILISLFAVGAGLYEGNIGTAFRHKGILLPFLLLIVAERYSYLGAPRLSKLVSRIKNLSFGRI